jgi:protein-S-isoprenylcysteine O-methyltransferase Ste14
MTSTMFEHPQKNKLNSNGRKRIFVITIYVCTEALLLFIAAGTLQWFAAWLYFLLRIGSMAVASFFVIRKNADIINKRGEKHEDTKPWDKAFGMVYILTILAFPIVAGLDFRYGWSDMALMWQIVGLIGAIPALILPYWAMSANQHLYTTVRLVEGHQVMKTGPYHYIRHPMYTGAILFSICSPLLLGSWWALIPGGIAALAMFVRTILEDRTLQAELPGYADFAKETRYRLVPGIW